ncbi:hypothetical protein [Streptomyces sp. NPDC006510]|uniref:hypothetical protein n=1 Tax=Streptomyces sp. NPDC006510 TaxID=3155600 RepID=UPI0033A2A5FF
MRAVFKALVADPDIGKGVHREAQKALEGAVDDLRYFLKTGLRIAQAEDDRVAIARIPAGPRHQRRPARGGPQGHGRNPGRAAPLP